MIDNFVIFKHIARFLLAVFLKCFLRHHWYSFLLERDLNRFPDNFVRMSAWLGHYSLHIQNLTLNFQKQNKIRT